MLKNKYIGLGNKFVAFLSKTFIQKKLKLKQYVDAFPPKINRSGIEEVAEPFLKVLFIAKGNAPHIVLIGSRK